MIKTAIHPSKKHMICFTEHDHVYKVDNEEYISGTTLIKKYFKPFDAEKIAHYLSKKKGCTKESLLKEWKAAGEYGTKVHLYAENLILGEKTPKPSNRKERNVFKQTKKFLEDFEETHGEILATETIVFSPKYKVAGTVDLIFMNKRGRISLGDWKTNKEIKMDNHWQNGKKFLSHLDDCNYNQYSLQMSLYRRIMYEEGYYKNKKFGGNYIFHLTESGVHTHRTPYMKSEVIKMLKANK